MGAVRVPVRAVYRLRADGKSEAPEFIYREIEVSEKLCIAFIEIMAMKPWEDVKAMIIQKFEREESKLWDLKQSTANARNAI